MKPDLTPRIYPLYRSLIEAHFWVPVFFLYFNQLVSVQGVLLLESVYYIAVVVTEVPSGYFSDRFGRKATLLIASASLSLAYCSFFLAHGLWWLIAGQLLLAVGLAFNSGADTSMHHDSLAAAGRQLEFADREAQVARFALLAGAGAALLGGLAAVFSLRAAYLLSMVGALGAVACVLLMREPALQKELGAERFIAQLTSCLMNLRSKPLLWLFSLAVLMVILNHVPYMFYQPYMKQLLGLLDVGGSTPLATGMQASLSLLLASMVANRSIHWRNRLGTGGVLLASMALQTLIIAIMAAAIHPLVALIIIARSMARGLMIAPLNAAVVPRVPRHERATYLSMQSLAGRLGFALYLLAMAALTGSTGADDWSSIRLLLTIGAGIGIAGLLALGVSARRVQLEPQTSR